MGKRYTIGLLTTEGFVRYAPGHWLGVADAARAHDSAARTWAVS